MYQNILLYCVLLSVHLLTLTSAQSSAEDGYIGYTLSSLNDANSDVIYATESTPSNVSTTDPPPDVVLNATVSVGEIDITVSNLTAKINLDVQVLNLLSFNAGIDAHIDRVSLTIKNVSAEVQLEARLGNLVLMINDVLDSIDLNPAIATLGQVVNSTLNSTASAISSTVAARSINLADNILYSINDYSGRTHTNRILAQDGSIVDQSLDNDGNLYSEKVVGDYSTEMTFNGYDESVTLSGLAERELQYVYQPYIGLEVISAIFLDAAGKVVATQVLSEFGGGGSSSLPVVLFLSWITLKLLLRRPGKWWVKLDDRAAEFQNVIGNLERLIYLRNEEDEDDSELAQLRTRTDPEIPIQDLASVVTGPSGILDMPEIGAQLFTPTMLSSNSFFLRVTHTAGIDNLRRRGTGDSEQEQPAPY